MSKSLHIALVGNPNCGKSSIFNYLTGLRQKVGNFPGVTVDKKVGWLTDEGQATKIIDLPGTYSLYPTAKDDIVVHDTLLSPKGQAPDGIIYIIDVTYLAKQLLMLSQIIDTGIPVVVALSMTDLRTEKEIRQITKALIDYFGIDVVPVSIKAQYNLDKLKALFKNRDWMTKKGKSDYVYSIKEHAIIAALDAIDDRRSGYQQLLVARYYDKLSFLSSHLQQKIKYQLELNDYNGLELEFEEISQRYLKLEPLQRKLNQVSRVIRQQSKTQWIDWLTTHAILGPTLFILTMFLTFQLIYSWAAWPTEWIERLFMEAGHWVNTIAGPEWFIDLLANGIIAGLGGIAVFAPQIALLFFIIAIMEETGYMARVIYLFDPLMRRFGLSGRSLVAMISSGACAIPAVMSTRIIKDEKKRLNTILVSPLISCSARLPVYTVLIGLMAPAIKIGWFNVQGLIFMGVYVLSILSTLIMAWVFKIWLKTDSQHQLLIELPIYRKPVLRNVLIYTWSKVKVFLLEAGKIILMVSLLLWVLASYGPGDHKARAKQDLAALRFVDQQNYDRVLASKELEYSYIGRVGKYIEPVLEPLGYDWKIGIGLITSFAAREVFVGTMATIYSVGNSDSMMSIRERMRTEINPKTGDPVYSLATTFSLLVFYLYAMQCMSTLAIVKRETGGWKWPIFQLCYMTVLAVFGAFTVFQLLS